MAPRRLAADPAWNLRLFSTACRASMRAAERWLGIPEGEGSASGMELGLLAEEDFPIPEPLASRAYRSDSRLWLPTGFQELRAVLGETEPRPLGSAPEAPTPESRGASPSEPGDASAPDTSPRLRPGGTRRAARNPDAGARCVDGELRVAVEGFRRELYAPAAPLVMGILNVTPDSFSDGGRWLDTEAAVARGLEMVAEGADVLDLGGESTRPGAAPVPAEEELWRVLPVLERLRPQTSALISIDTQKAEVAAACLAAGADWINDVSGLTTAPGLADVVAQYPGRKLVLMHWRRKPGEERYSTEYDASGRPAYVDVVADTMRWLRRQIGIAVERGVAEADLWIDPGFGFGKTFEQNVELLQRLREYTSIGAPVLVGTSRKSSVGRLVGDLPPEERREGTAATVAWAISQGARCVRVHDVKEMARVVRAAAALR